MYGIINQAIQKLVTENFGKDTWEKVKRKVGHDFPSFLTHETYDDNITFQLSQATAEVLELSLSEVLITFGEYWILKTSVENYGSLMKAGGNDLREFLINLPNFHSRVMLMFPNLMPPEFKVDHVQENSLYVHYFSGRAGLTDFVRGLLQGLGKMYKTEVVIELVQGRDQGEDHDIFAVKW